MEKPFLEKIKQKQVVFAVALTLLLALSVVVTVIPTASAHDPAWEVETWTFCVVSPNPIGVNQPTSIIFWLNLPPPTASGPSGDRWQFYIDLTSPDGTTDTLGPFTSDPVGGSYAQFTPDQVGK
jgi:hypothetical protein